MLRGWSKGAVFASLATGGGALAGVYPLLGFRPVVLGLIAANVASFVLFAADKAIARWHSGGQRVPERVLLGFALFGAGGAWAAMLLVRHKTQHRLFRYGVPAMLFATAAVVVALSARR